MELKIEINKLNILLKKIVMERGIIYLVQPYEHVGTSVYKIGRSGNTSLDRCRNGYKKGSRYLCINECINPIILENKIKKEFNTSFKLVIGKEYFEGNEKNIKSLFRNLVEEHEEVYPIAIENTKQAIEPTSETTKTTTYIPIKTTTDTHIKTTTEHITKTAIDTTTETANGTFICKFCKKEYTSINSRINHYKIKHLAEYNQYKIKKEETKLNCKKCNKLFSHRNSKNRHEKTCNNQTQIKDLQKTVKELTEKLNTIIDKQNKTALLTAKNK